MKTLSKVTEEVVYPLLYSQWYGHDANAYDFASNEDLADLEKIHPRWTFEKKARGLGDYGDQTRAEVVKKKGSDHIVVRPKPVECGYSVYNRHRS